MIDPALLEAVIAPRTELTLQLKKSGYAFSRFSPRGLYFQLREKHLNGVREGGKITLEQWGIKADVTETWVSG